MFNTWDPRVSYVSFMAPTQFFNRRQANDPESSAGYDDGDADDIVPAPVEDPSGAPHHNGLDS